MDEAFWMRRSKKKPISLPLGILPLCPRRLGLCNKSAFGPWAVIRSVNLCTSFTLLREVMLSMALTFFGLASIPHWETMNPKNLRDKTLNTHFTLISSNTSSKCRKSLWGHPSVIVPFYFLQACHPHIPSYFVQSACWTCDSLAYDIWPLHSSGQTA